MFHLKIKHLRLRVRIFFGKYFPCSQSLAISDLIFQSSLGSIVGLSLSATVVQQTLQAQLRDRLKSGNDADHIVKKVQESLEYIKTLEPGTREVVRECYAVATRNGFAFMLGLVSIAMFASCMFEFLMRSLARLTARFSVHKREEAWQVVGL